MMCIIIILLILLLIMVILCFFMFIGRRQKNNVNRISEPTLGYAKNTDPFKYPFVLHNVLTLEECEEIIKYSKDKLFDSEVVGGKMKDVRNSQQYWIPRDHPLVMSLYQKLSKFFNIPIENAEDLQVVRYLPGQYYKEHHDSCCDNNRKCIEFAQKGGQRILTVLIYLNNDFEEGNTYFPNLNLKVKPPVGSALVFYPLATDTNKCHPLALHAGLPVKSGEKWIANIWFRERTFRS